MSAGTHHTRARYTTKPSTMDRKNMPKVDGGNGHDDIIPVEEI